VVVVDGQVEHGDGGEAFLVKVHARRTMHVAFSHLHVGHRDGALQR
jgi:hypothetical protein